MPHSKPSAAQSPSPPPTSPHDVASPPSPGDPPSSSAATLFGAPDGALATSHVGSYTLYGTIGEGAFGKVKIAVDRRNDVRVAVKIMDKAEIRAQQFTAQVRREIHVMRSLKHPHIVRLHEVLTSNTKLYIVMELVTGGELFQHIERGAISEPLARRYFQQLVDGVHFCHKSGVAHRDLKPENLLLDTDGNIKITDFGFSSMKGMDVNMGLLYTQCGTPDYCAPEIIDNAHNGYSGAKVDAWSCGIILFALLCGKLPFEELETHRLYDLILACDVVYPPHLSPDARDLLQNLLVRDPDRRYDLYKVKRHPWFLVDYAGDDARAIKKAPFFKPRDASGSQPPSPSAPPSRPPISPGVRSRPHSPPEATAGNHAPISPTAPQQMQTQQQHRLQLQAQQQLQSQHRPPPPQPPSLQPRASPPMPPLSRVTPPPPAPNAMRTSPPRSHLSPNAPVSPTNGLPHEDTHSPFAPAVPVTSPTSPPPLASYGVANAHSPRHCVSGSSPPPQTYYHPAPSPTTPNDVAAEAAAYHLGMPTSPHAYSAAPSPVAHPNTPDATYSFADRQPPLDRPPSTSAYPHVAMAYSPHGQYPSSPHDARRAQPTVAAAASPHKTPLHHHQQQRIAEMVKATAAAPSAVIPGNIVSGVNHHGPDLSRPRPALRHSASTPTAISLHSPRLHAPTLPDHQEDSGSESDSVIDYANKPAVVLELPANPRQLIRKMTTEEGRQRTIGRAQQLRQRSDLAASTISRTVPGRPVTKDVTPDYSTSRRPRFAREGSITPSLKDPRAVLVPISNEPASVPPVVYSPSLGGGKSYEPFNSGSHGSLRRADDNVQEVSQDDRLPSIKLPANHTMRGQRVDGSHDGPSSSGSTGQAGVLSHHMWTMVGKLQGAGNSANLKLGDELREDMQVLTSELQYLSKDDAWVILSQFLSLFESQGLSPPEPLPISTAAKRRKEGGIVASVSDTDMLTHLIPKMTMADVVSEEESLSSVSLSPVVAEVSGPHSHEIARRRDVSDLLNRWIKSADQQQQGHEGGNSSDEPLQGPELAELHRLLRRYRNGRESSNVADELLQILNNQGEEIEPRPVRYVEHGAEMANRSLDMAQAPPRYFSNMSNPSRCSTPVRSSSSNNIPLPSEYVPGRFQETRSLPLNGKRRPTEQGSGSSDENASGDGSTETTDSHDHSRMSEMAHSMGLSDVAYYNSDKRNGMGNKLREVLHTMKAKNQRLGECQAQFKSSLPAEDIMRLLGRVLQDMGGLVTIKRETKRKMKCRLPVSEDETLHAGIELSDRVRGLTYVSFRRSKADKGRTNTDAFHTFFEEARQRFINEAATQFPWARNSKTKRVFGSRRKKHREDGSRAISDGSAGQSRELIDAVVVEPER